jgi:hypothetical protein
MVTDEVNTRLPMEIREVCQAFLNGLTGALGEKLFGVYIYGAVAFPDTFAIGDIDFHVILREALTGTEKANIDRLHQDLQRDHPPLGGELDGYYILLEAVQGETPPQSQMWSLATDFACEQIAHSRAGRG